MPLALAFTGAGFKVLGFDVQKKRADLVNRGRSFITGISDKELAKPVKAGRLKATTDHITHEQGTNTLIGSNCGKLQREARGIAPHQSQDNTHRLPECPALWEGQTAQRIIAILATIK